MGGIEFQRVRSIKIKKKRLYAIHALVSRSKQRCGHCGTIQPKISRIRSRVRVINNHEDDIIVETSQDCNKGYVKEFFLSAQKAVDILYVRSLFCVAISDICNAFIEICACANP